MTKYLIGGLLGLGVLTLLYTTEPHDTSSLPDTTSIQDKTKSPQVTEDTFIGNPDLHFSNTQEWDNTYYSVKYQISTSSREAWLEKIHLLPPPENDSAVTREELKTLHSYVSQRTPEVIAEIKEQDRFHGSLAFGPLRMKDFLFSLSKPATMAVFQYAYTDFSPLITSEKEKFDRVRPSMLDTSLTTIIPVPGHPAYPSGHSSETHMIALILGELIPSQKEVFYEAADKISHNREIAGLHYPSDTEAGKMLAQQFFEIISTKPEFKELLEKAKNEWPPIPETKTEGL